MPLLSKILQWSAGLPVWQRDALRRLFQREDLTEQDYDDLYAILKAARGIPDEKKRQAVPLASEHLPASAAGAPVVLDSMHDLLHVNRIASGQTLKFSPTGMTVIYGGNGSGKSGYSRVLKRACRARDQSEDILTDASNPAERNTVPEAIFDVSVGASTKTLKWIKGTVPPDELSTIAVFDSHCARAYLREGEAAYLPYGMDIVVNLADKVIPELIQRLKKDISCINVDVAPFNHLRGETAAGKLVAVLGAQTDVTQINTLAALSDAEISRIAELKAVLSEADPLAKAKDIQLSANRIKDVALRIKNALKWVKADSVNRLRSYYDEMLAAEKCEKTAAQALQSGENLLPGTGEQIWKSLFEAARKFSTEVAYNGQPFPHVEDGAVCPLCQQPIAVAGERLRRFEKYIQDAAAKTAEEKRHKLSEITTKIERADISMLLDSSLKAEMNLLDPAIVIAIAAYADCMETRRTWMLNAVNSRCWDNMAEFSEDPIPILRRNAAKQLRAARTFKKAADQTKKANLKAENDELVARKNLKASLQPILALVDRMKAKAALDSCNADLNTLPITKMSKNLAEDVITRALKKALDDEFGNLGIGHIKTKIDQRNAKGKPLYTLLLNLPTTARLESILSEGEQRAIALGSFLAELKLAGHKGGIVFDDPVSSLDHHRRKRVAERLVKEAAQRQVIVFTHDTVFLCELCEQMQLQGITNLVQHLEWENNAPGNIKRGLPWKHKGYAERLEKLKHEQRKLAPNWPPYPNEAECVVMSNLYGWFRATIERAIKDIVFNDVIDRYRDDMKVGKLLDVGGLEKHVCAEICRLHKRCSNVIDAHDKSSIKNAGVPTPTDLGNDIIALEAAIQTIKDSR